MKCGQWESYRFYVYITNFVTNTAWILVVASGMLDFHSSHVRVYVLINIKYIFVCIYVYKNYESQTSFINSPPALFGHLHKSESADIEVICWITQILLFVAFLFFGEIYISVLYIFWLCNFGHLQQQYPVSTTSCWWPMESETWWDQITGTWLWFKALVYIVYIGTREVADGMVWIRSCISPCGLWSSAV